MIPDEKITKALKEDKNFMLICAGCGNASYIGADIETDYLSNDGKTCYNMYSYQIRDKDKSITADDFSDKENHKAISEIFYSQGIKVPMMTGMYATDYYNGRFSDRWHPDFYKIQRNDITVEEIMKFIDDYNHDRTTVNMNAFIRQTPDDILKEISRYSIKGFNWKGTKYETEWNSK